MTEFATTAVLQPPGLEPPVLPVVDAADPPLPDDLPDDLLDDLLVDEVSIDGMCGVY